MNGWAKTSDVLLIGTRIAVESYADFMEVPLVDVSIAVEDHLIRGVE